MPLDLRGVITWDDRSGPALSKLEGNMQRLSQVGRTVTIAGAAITGALTASMHSAAAYGDEIAKASAKTNISTQELSRLRYAAEQTGSNFNTMTGSLARMQRAAADANDGAAMQKEAFDRLGVSVVDANGELKGAEQLFKEIAQGLSEQENRTLRAATAMQIFGRGGVNMLPLLNEGAAGIEKLGQRAEELGIVWDEKASKAAERYNDALNDVKRSTQGLGQTLVVTLGPAVAEVAETVAEAMGTFSEWADKNPEWAKVIVFSIAGVGLALGVGGPILVALPYLLNGLNAIRTAFTTTAATAEAAAVTTGRAATQMATAGATAQGIAGGGAASGVAGGAAGGAAARGLGTAGKVGIGATAARGGIAALWATAAYTAYRTGSYVYDTGREAIEAKGAQQVYEQYQREGRSAEEIARAKAVFQREAGEFGMRATDVPFRSLFNESRLRRGEAEAAKLLAQAEQAGYMSERYPKMVVEVRLSGDGNIAETMLKDPQAREQMSRFIGEEAMKASYAPGG